MVSTDTCMVRNGGMPEPDADSANSRCPASIDRHGGAAHCRRYHSLGRHFFHTVPSRCPWLQRGSTSQLPEMVNRNISACCYRPSVRALGDSVRYEEQRDHQTLQRGHTNNYQLNGGSAVRKSTIVEAFSSISACDSLASCRWSSSCRAAIARLVDNLAEMRNTRTVVLEPGQRRVRG